MWKLKDIKIMDSDLYDCYLSANDNTKFFECLHEVQQETFKEFLVNLEDQLESHIDGHRDEAYNEGYEKKEEEYQDELDDVKYPDKANIETALRYMGIKNPSLADISKLEWFIDNYDRIK